MPPSLDGTEQVQTAKLLGVIFQSNLNFTSHVDAVLKSCSKRIFLLKQLGRLKTREWKTREHQK